MTFRSPLLQAYPTRRGRVLNTHRRRALWVSIACFAIGIPSAMVAMRLPPVQGWGYPLYWLHDHLYLPLQGQLFTRFLPYSIAAWILIAVGLCGLLFSVLTGLSPLHALHLKLLELTLASRRARPLLLAASVRLLRFGVNAAMMAEVCDSMRRRSSARSETPESTDEELALCRFLCELTLRCDLPDAFQLRAALAIQETLEKRLPQRQCPPALVQLLERLPILLKRLTRPDSTNPYSHENSGQPFGAAAFAADLLRVARAHHPQLPAAVWSPRDTRNELVWTSQLALANDQRRAALDQLRHTIEDRQLRQRPGSLPSLPFEHAPLADLPWWGRWYFSLVMTQSLLEGCPDSALRQLDTLEALRLTLALVPSDEEAAPPESRLGALLGDLPLPRHWRCLASWAENDLNRSREQLASSTLQREGVLRGDEFDLLQERMWALQHAAGPDQLPTEGT